MGAVFIVALLATVAVMGTPSPAGHEHSLDEHSAFQRSAKSAAIGTAAVMVTGSVPRYGTVATQLVSDLYTFYRYGLLSDMRGHQPGDTRHDGTIGRPDENDTRVFSDVLSQLTGQRLWQTQHAALSEWAGADGRGWFACGELRLFRELGLISEDEELRVWLISGERYECDVGANEKIIVRLQSEAVAAALFIMFTATLIDVACVRVWQFIDSQLNGVEIPGVVERWERPGGGGAETGECPSRRDLMFPNEGGLRRPPVPVTITPTHNMPMHRDGPHASTSNRSVATPFIFPMAVEGWWRVEKDPAGAIVGALGVVSTSAPPPAGCVVEVSGGVGELIGMCTKCGRHALLHACLTSDRGWLCRLCTVPTAEPRFANAD
ncbi:hypothetical protein FOA52_015932 [Chlamydomonas sp. UWO 241]|nr:hypothetical protein FOA52_015932 [Chlamydomonas sp. UWO 241]